MNEKDILFLKEKILEIEKNIKSEPEKCLTSISEIKNKLDNTDNFRHKHLTFIGKWGFKINTVRVGKLNIWHVCMSVISRTVLKLNGMDKYDRLFLFIENDQIFFFDPDTFVTFKCDHVKYIVFADYYIKANPV